MVKRKRRRLKKGPLIVLILLVAISGYFLLSKKATKEPVENDVDFQVQKEIVDIVSVDEMNVDVEKDIKVIGNKSLDMKLSEDVSVDTKGKNTLTAAKDISFKTSGGKVAMGNNVSGLYEVLSDLYDKLNDIAKDVAKMKTAGAPTNHVVSPDDIATFTALSGQITASKTKMQQVFKS